MRRRITLVGVMILCSECAPDTVTSPRLTFEILSPDVLTEGDGGASKGCKPSASQPCVLRGGEDSLVVHAAFDDIDIEESKSVAVPTVTILADGSALTAPTMSAVGINPRSFVSTPFLAPAHAAQSLAVRVVAAPGYEANETGFRVDAPRITLVTTCGVEGVDANAECTRTLGHATVSYTAWVPGGSKATLTSLLDGVPHGPPIEQSLEVGSGGAASAVFSLPVPDHGRRWAIAVDTESAPRAERIIVLSEPESISLALLGCTSSPDSVTAEVESCAQGAGLSLQVTAPRGVHATEAIVRTLIDSVYTPDVISIPLDIADGSHELGVAQVVLPSTGGRVEYRAAVGPSFAKAVSIKLVPPAMAATD